MSFPSPAPIYNRENEAQFRAAVDRLLAEVPTSASVESPTLGAGSNNDYALGADTALVRVTTNAAGSTLTGFVAPRSGTDRARTFILVNLGSAALTIAHQNASSTAEYRIITPDAASWTLTATATVAFVYDDLTARWRLVQPRPIVAPVALFDHYTNANNGTTVETDLYSDTLAAARLAANGEKIEARYGGIFAGDATSSQQLRAYFGGTQVFDSGALLVGATNSWDLYVTVIRVSASVVRVSASMTSDFVSLPGSAVYTEVTGLTLANTQILKITGQAAGASGGSNQITAKLGRVTWQGAA